MKRLIDLLTMDRLDHLIRLQATGTPKDLAFRLRISERNLYEVIAFMRNYMQAPIRYSRYLPSYVYDYPPRFYLGFEKDRFQSNETENLSGETGKENQEPSSSSTIPLTIINPLNLKS